jgi:hypothetical protein
MKAKTERVTRLDYCQYLIVWTFDKVSEKGGTAYNWEL